MPSNPTPLTIAQRESVCKRWHFLFLFLTRLGQLCQIISVHHLSNRGALHINEIHLIQPHYKWDSRNQWPRKGYTSCIHYRSLGLGQQITPKASKSFGSQMLSEKH
jgi:hypothetical protein